MSTTDKTPNPNNEESQPITMSEVYIGFVENMPMPIGIFRSDGLLVAVNKQWELYSGVPADAVVNRYNALEDPQVVETGLIDFFKQALAGETIQTPPLPYTVQKGGAFGNYADGRKLWIRLNYYPIYDDEGNVAYCASIITDVTEQQEQAEIIEMQAQTLEDVSTPIIPLMHSIIVMPLVGSVDSRRARDITRALLGGISQYRAKVVILDITGVAMVDSGVADHLNKTIQAARLKGAQTIITGISDAVAETIVDLGIDWGGIETLRDLQTGLLLALERMGISIDFGE